MTGTIRLAACAALALVLAGCTTPEPYPRAVNDIGESADYPVEAAGFRRGRILIWDTDARDVSVDYVSCDSGYPFSGYSATLHIAKAGGVSDSVKARFDAAKSKIEESGFGEDLLEERSVVLTKHGKKYVALKAGYSGSAHLHACIIGEIPVPMYFEAIIWRYEDTIISLESSELSENRDIASAKNLELLDAVNWTVLPF